MINKIHSEFRFTNKISEEKTIGLTVYINYEKKTYDFMQDCQEGIFPSTNNNDVVINRAYFKLGLEIIDFVEKELYSN
jgi:hypothetical protein